jgi:hypothetical protein
VPPPLHGAPLLATDPTLIQIRERSFSDVLDLALVVVRNRPKTLGLAALAGVAPFALLNAWLTLNPGFPTFGYLALLVLESPWATAPLTVVLGGLMFGERPSTRHVIATLLRGLPAMIAYQFVIRALLLVTFILYPIMPAKLAFLNEVILLERCPFGGAMRRCSTLSGARGSDLFGYWAAEVFFGGLFVICFWAGTSVIQSALFTSQITWDQPGWSDLYGLRLQVAVWVAIAFFGVVRFLTYIDQRIRLEGWEVKLRLQAVGRAMEEAGRW